MQKNFVVGIFKVDTPRHRAILDKSILDKGFQKDSSSTTKENGSVHTETEKLSNTFEASDLPSLTPLKATRYEKDEEDGPKRVTVNAGYKVPIEYEEESAEPETAEPEKKSSGPMTPEKFSRKDDEASTPTSSKALSPSTQSPYQPHLQETYSDRCCGRTAAQGLASQLTSQGKLKSFTFKKIDHDK